MSTLTRADIEALIQEARNDDRRLDLSERDLSGLNLNHLNLRWADLRGALWGGLTIDRLPSGHVYLIPTPDGWYMHVGCWDGTPDQLRRLIAQDDGWPEAEGAEITCRRPCLEAALALCEVHMADHADVIDDLREHWKSAEEEAA